jgi:hypothetical protein
VTGVGFSVDGVFTAGGGCDGEPGCDGFTFTAGTGGCTVDVTAIGTSSEDVSMSLDGTCTAEDLGACEDLEGAHGAVSLITPFTPETESSSEETTTDEPETTTSTE